MTFDRVIDEALVPELPLSFGDVVSLNSVDVIFLSAAFVAWALASLTNGATRGGSGLHVKHDKARRSVPRQPIGKAFLAMVAVCAFELAEAGLTAETKYLGIAGLLIGIAAQGTLSDLLSGFAIRMGRLLAPGDLIEIDGLYGYVCRLAPRSVCLRTPNGAMVNLPNSELVSRTIVNYHAFPHQLLVFKCSSLSVEDIHRTRRQMLSVVGGRIGILDAPAPRVIVNALSENGITLELQAWVEKGHDSQTYRAALRDEIAVALCDANVDIGTQPMGSTLAIETARLEWPIY